MASLRYFHQRKEFKITQHGTTKSSSSSKLFLRTLVKIDLRSCELAKGYEIDERHAG